MDKHLKQLYVLALLVTSLTLFGVFLTFAVFEVQASYNYSTLKTKEPVVCGQALRNKIINYSQSDKPAKAFTPAEDQMLRFQLKAQAMGPMLNTLSYFHQAYLKDSIRLNNPSLLAVLNDYLIEEKERVQFILNDLRYDPLPVELEDCRAAIVDSWEEALMLTDNVLVIPQDEHQEKYEEFYNKNHLALRLCQKEAVKHVNLPSIELADQEILNQPLACLITSSSFKSRWQKQGENFYSATGLKEIENILNNKTYHPLLSRYFLTWRAAKQFTEFGGANANYIPNQLYNEKRQELYEIIRQHLVNNPSDAWAKNQLIELVIFDDILRGGAGNSVLNYYYFDTGQY